MTPQHPLIDAMLAELPPPGAWAKEQRNKWTVAFGAVLDLIYSGGAAPAPATAIENGAALTANQEHVLLYLRTTCGTDGAVLSLKHIAQGSGTPQGSLPPTLDKLVKLNLIGRQKDVESRSIKYWVRERGHD
jgi:DNA-binding MarR family transcriptional regulator